MERPIQMVQNGCQALAALPRPQVALCASSTARSIASSGAKPPSVPPSYARAPADSRVRSAASCATIRM
eukprot:scaffold12470_cov119-Isochrysis_galbana.AAC.7